ncbi:hypothetical protein [Desulfosporosinus burensis]
MRAQSKKTSVKGCPLLVNTVMFFKALTFALHLHTIHRSEVAVDRFLSAAAKNPT